MTNQQVRESAEVRQLRFALQKLRAREGLTAARLRAVADTDIDPLLQLDSVERHASLRNVDPPEAALEVVAECVRSGLEGSDRIVADAILGLNLFADSYREAGVNPRVVAGLRSALVQDRRHCLLSGWPQLHSALNVPQAGTPSDRSLRGPVERQVLMKLARLLLGAYDAPSRQTARAKATAGRVIVVGGVVMDSHFRVRELPAQTGRSARADMFKLAPGGKGLHQAMAAEALGLNVSLLAAVADDRFRDQITGYIAHRGIGIELLKYKRGATAVFNGILEVQQGDSIAAYERRDKEGLEPRDIQPHIDALRDCDAVLMTFEVPLETAQYTLRALRHDRGPGRRPHVIMTPAQPYDNGEIAGDALGRIDYLVANRWELEFLWQSANSKSDSDLDNIARHLLADGVGTLCALSSGGCQIYSDRFSRSAAGNSDLPTYPAVPMNSHEMAVARDVFCAALAAKLIESGDASTSVAWAIAAMAAAAHRHREENPIPSQDDVESYVEQKAPFLRPFMNRTTAGGDQANGRAARLASGGPAW